ncbi:MAG: putative molybdenum carrier protein [Rhodospirillales bacterium]|nr:putative molybdenum carrier protein [Rhodospirillales bacterium]
MVSGGQTGADRAALDVALDLGIACGGWCPRGRMAEDGVLDMRYPLTETPRRQYIQRTEWNVRDSDGTLIVARPPLSGGTAATESLARTRGKPCLVVHPDDDEWRATLRTWLEANDIAVLNIAGPRESSGDLPYAATERLLRGLFDGG